MKAVSRTHIGNVRASNQDALLVQEGDFGVSAVADGMGGHKAGDVASQMAVAIVGERLKGLRPTAGALKKGIEEANRKIYDQQLTNRDLSGMGTTMTALWEDQKRILLGHVGDSRAYRVRGGEMDQLSQDHSMVGELVRQGVLTLEEAQRHPYRNIITRALGAESTVDVDIMDLAKLPGDIYLICSDGLYEYIQDEEMKRILLSQPMNQAADTLLSLALHRGGQDNISLVIGEVDR